MKVEIILSIVIAASTVIYTIINALVLVENRRTRKQKISPLIIAFLKTTDDHAVLCLYLKNIGEGLARNVRIELKKDYMQFGESNMSLSNIGIFKNGFSTFPPSYELKFYLNSTVDIKEADKNNVIELDIYYERTDRKKMKSHYRLEFIQVMGQNYSNPPESYIGKIPFYLKEIDRSIKKMLK